MRVTRLKCPDCGASLKDASGFTYCFHCDALLFIDDEVRRSSHTERKEDVARILENERKREIRQLELENAERESKRKSRRAYFEIILPIVLLFAIFFYFSNSNTSTDDRIKVPLSAKEYKKNNYEQVIVELKNAGFTNIELVAQKDLVTGWLTKEGSVERISIDGVVDFEAGDRFSSDAKIVITYHAYKKDES